MLMNRSAKLWFCSFNKASVALRGPLSPEALLMNQRMLKWNKSPVYSLSISPVFSLPLASSVFFSTSFKNCQIFLNFFSVWFLLGEEDNNYVTILVFLFHKIIKSFWTDSYCDRSTIDTNRHAVSARKLMLLGGGIYFPKHFFFCGMFGKWTAKEKLFQVVLSRTVSQKHQELCIVSQSCSLA